MTISTSSRREKSTGRFGLHFLIDAKVPFGNANHARYSDTFRKSAANAARHEQVADIHLIGALYVFNSHYVPSRIPNPAYEPSRTRALDDYIDAEPTVNGQLNVDSVARDTHDGSDSAVQRHDWHVRPDSNARRVQRKLRDSKVLGRVLADDRGACNFIGNRFTQAEQAQQAPVLDLDGGNFSNFRTQPRILISQLVVVCFDIDKVEVVPDDARDTARSGRREILQRRGHSHHGAINSVHFFGSPNACPEEEERHCE